MFFRRRSTKILSVLFVIALIVPLYFGMTVKHVIEERLAHISLPGYDLKWHYDMGWLSSQAQVSLTPRHDFLSPLSTTIELDIMHGPFFQVAEGEGKHWRFGYAALQGHAYWLGRKIQRLSGYVDLDANTTLWLLPARYSGKLQANRRQYEVDWRGIAGRLRVSAKNNNYSLMAVLHPFAWRNEQGKEGHVSPINIKMFGRLQKNGISVDGLDIANSEIAWLSANKKIHTSLLSTHLSLDMVDGLNGLSQAVLRLRIGQMNFMDQRMGPLLWQLDISQLDRTTLRQVLHKLNQTTGKYSPAAWATELEAVLESLPKGQMMFSLHTDDGIFSLSAHASANQHLATMPKSLMKLMPSMLLFRLVNAEAILSVPEAFVHHIMTEYAEKQGENSPLVKQMDYLYEQLRARNALVQRGASLHSEVRLYDGSPTINGEPLLPLIFSVMASMLLVD